MARRKKKLGEILVGWGLLNANDLADALKYASEHDKRIGEALVELELCSEDDVCKALATQFGLEYVDLDKNVIDHAVLELIPDDLIRRHMVLPMGLEGDALKIIITDPLDLETLDVVRFRLAKELKPALAPLGKVKRFIDTFINPMDDELSKTLSSIDQDRPDDEKDDLHLDADD
ncbi:MAG: hypothetical protein IID37_12590, partial [Planctomycetes bacterium]|nr:hypothetical protein [Planctomycetota bacterium]